MLTRISDYVFIKYVHIVKSRISIKLTWFGAEGFPRRPSQGWLWYCCYGSPCKYKTYGLSIFFLILCVCVCMRVCLEGRQSVFVSERQVICPHVAPAVAQLKNIFGHMRCKHAHIRCICDTYAHCGTSAEAEGKHSLCVRAGKRVCGCVASTCLGRERLYPSATLKSLNGITWDNATMIVMLGRCVFVCALVRVCALTVPEAYSVSWWPQGTPGDHCSSNPWERERGRKINSHDYIRYWNVDSMTWWRFYFPVREIIIHPYVIFCVKETVSNRKRVHNHLLSTLRDG